MWWVEGYPYGFHVKDERRPVRVIQSDKFVLALNTETLQIENFGLRKSNLSYMDSVKRFSNLWSKLPAAELEISYQLNDEKYIAVGANPPRRSDRIHYGPRLIESGRFWQRGDVWMINFKDERGNIITKNCHLEIGAWSDQIILKVRLVEKDGNGAIFLRFKSVDSEWLAEGSVTNGKGQANLSLQVQGEEFVATDKNSVDGLTILARQVREKELAKFSKDFQAHVVDLSELSKSALPAGASENDCLLKCPILIKNTSDKALSANIVFEYPRKKGFQTNHGVPITGVSAILCDEQGRPAGIPVQLSKNWHVKKDFNRIPYDSSWFRGFTSIEVPPGVEQRYELRIIHGHWGRLPAASHAQLSLIGWGTNQLWEQSALGAWGETFCYEPTRAHRDSFVTDVRPLMISSKRGEKWDWAHNMGGADFLRIERLDGSRMSSRQVKGLYVSPGPCLTDTRYTGVLGDNEATFEIKTSLARSNDMARAVYEVELVVNRDIEVSSAAIFQLGADFYNDPTDRKIAWGNLEGVDTELFSGELADKGDVIELSGAQPWVSLHDTKRTKQYGEKGGLATRGLVIREWEAFVGGEKVSPYLHADKTSKSNRDQESPVQAEIVLSQGGAKLVKGDRVSAIFEILMPPQLIAEYYGKNNELRTLTDGKLNKWQVVFDNAKRHQHDVTVKTGELVRVLPDVKVKAKQNAASFEIEGGHYKYTPVTFSGLSSPNVGEVIVNGQKLGQELYGNDYYQVDYDEPTQTWSKTFNIKFSQVGKNTVTFK